MITSIIILKLSDGSGTTTIPSGWNVSEVIGTSSAGFKKVDYTITDNVLSITGASKYTSASIYLYKDDTNGTTGDINDAIKADMVCKLPEVDLVSTYSKKDLVGAGGQKYRYARCKTLFDIIDSYATINEIFDYSTIKKFTNGTLSELNQSTNLMSFTGEPSEYASSVNIENWAVNQGYTSFSCGVPSLKCANTMFSNGPLTSFTSELPSLERGNRMFCSTKISSFNIKTPKLKNGFMMFYNCTSLTSFSGDLSSLTAGGDMFYGCNLDIDSLTNIADTINDVTSLETNYNDEFSSECVTKTIGLGLNHTVNDDDKIQIKKMTDKGWTVNIGWTTYSPS